MESAVGWGTALCADCCVETVPHATILGSVGLGWRMANIMSEEIPLARTESRHLGSCIVYLGALSCPACRPLQMPLRMALLLSSIRTVLNAGMIYTVRPTPCTNPPCCHRPLTSNRPARHCASRHHCPVSSPAALIPSLQPVMSH